MSDEENLLQLSRNGLRGEIVELLERNPTIDINCKGESKSTYSWTALHLASYFGHKEVVEVLLDRGADPNIRNHTGDSPLHKAALTSRQEVVYCLLNNGSDPTMLNDERKLPSHVASDLLIKNELEAAEKVQVMKETERFLRLVKEGRLSKVEEMITTSSNFAKIDGLDEQGNSPLHHAAMRDQRTIAIVLLQHGADPSKQNKQGERPCDVTISGQMRKILEVKPVRQRHRVVQRFEGPLMKRKRFLSPRWHWVVLERGVMSYFARRADAAVGSKRRFFKYLTESTVVKHDDNNYGFSVRFYDGTYHHLMVHQNNKPLINRQKWLDAIENHTEYSNHFVAADNLMESDSDNDEPIRPIVDIKNIVQTAEVHQKVLRSQVECLVPMVQKFVAQEGGGGGNRQLVSSHLLGKCHEILTTSTDMLQQFNHCLDVMQRQDQIRESKLTEERERTRVLQEALQSLATEHHHLERTIHSSSGGSPSKMPCTPKEASGSSLTPSGGILPDEDEFYDAVSGESSDNDVRDDDVIDDDVIDFQDAEDSKVEARYNDVTKNDYDPATQASAAPSGYRDRLPVSMFSRDDFSIWHILRQCIGKELSKITMPVIFNEPLSFIQRLCEYMEYSCLLEEASAVGDSTRRMELVSAFAVSALASQLDRLGKPFNPLLGETFSYNRPDLGFKWVSEQVSHHPPISAFHATGTKHDFTFHGSIHPKLKFWGKSVEIEPRGQITLHLRNPDETYTWTNPKCSVHNIVVGKLWIEQHGVMEILNHRTKERCVVNFKPYSWFKNDLNKIEATLFDENKRPIRILEGDWTKHLYSFSLDAHERFVATTTNPKTNGAKPNRRKSTASTSSDDIAGFMTSQNDDVTCLWEVQKRPDWSAEMYNMTKFAMSLNQNEVKGHPPTDTRLRPDIRALENGDIDGASEEKHRLEEKQRTARKLRHKKKLEWVPRWFEKKQNVATRSEEWTFNEQYLASDWSKSPDIF